MKKNSRSKKAGTSYIEHIQRLVDRYVSMGNEWPATARQIARWAIDSGAWEIGRESLVNRCAEDIARAMREEYYTDPQGRTVRSKHAARISTDDGQMTFWADIRTASPAHIRIAFQQRREQIVGDCRQLKADVDSYNENANPMNPVQLVLDFTDDVQELESLRRAS